MDIQIMHGDLDSLQAIIDIDYKSYIDIYLDYKPRSYIDVLSFFEKSNNGLFIAKVDGEIVGFLFTRPLGSLSWCGPMSVLPKYSGNGIGKKMLDTATTYLIEKGCKVVGFETTPNLVPMYIKWGWLATSVTYFSEIPAHKLVQSINNNDNSYHLLKTTSSQVKNFIKEIEEKTFNGLNLFNEIEYDEKKMETSTYLISYSNKPKGIASIKILDNYIIVRQLIMDKKNLGSLEQFIYALANICKKKQIKNILLPINSLYAIELHRLLGMGFIPKSYSIRFQTIDCIPYINDSSILFMHWGT